MVNSIHIIFLSLVAPVPKHGKSQTLQILECRWNSLKEWVKWANPDFNVFAYEECETTDVLFSIPSGEKAFEKATDRAECALPKNCRILNEYLSHSPIIEEPGFFPRGSVRNQGFRETFKHVSFQTFNQWRPEAGNGDSVIRFLFELHYHLWSFASSSLQKIEY